VEQAVSTDDERQVAAMAMITTITLLLLERGCPVALLDEVWGILAAQQIETTPGRLVAQIDAAVARARD
jgi:hypothetical protein